MKHLLSLLFLLSLIILPMTARCADFVAKTHEYQIFSLPYREAVLASDDAGAPALVVLLHARHGCGVNNDAHNKADGVNEIVNYLSKNGINAIIVVPQAPNGREWNEKDKNGGFLMSDALKSLIDTYIEDNTIDTQRIYILGASMGGSGVWRMINDNPDMFAAAMAVSAKARDVKLSNVLTTPIISVIGSRDRMVNAGSMEGVVKKINKNGGKAKFVLLDGYSHGEACRGAFTEDNLDWVFSHIKQETLSLQ